MIVFHLDVCRDVLYKKPPSFDALSLVQRLSK